MKGPHGAYHTSCIHAPSRCVNTTWWTKFLVLGLKRVDVSPFCFKLRQNPHGNHSRSSGHQEPRGHARASAKAGVQKVGSRPEQHWDLAAALEVLYNHHLVAGLQLGSLRDAAKKGTPQLARKGVGVGQEGPRKPSSSKVFWESPPIGGGAAKPPICGRPVGGGATTKNILCRFGLRLQTSTFDEPRG